MESYFYDEEIPVNDMTSFVPTFNDELHILDKIHVRITLILLYTVIFIFCVFGNLAVILVVTLHWRMRSITKICLGNMAVANLSVGIFCIYQNLSTYLFDSWLFGNLMCKMYHFVSGLCSTASILILVVLSIERYLVLLHSFKSIRMLTKRNLVLTVLGVWTVAAIISLPRLFYFGLLHVSLSDTHSGEICVPQKSKYNSATADTIYFVLLYVIPLGILTVLYARIGFYLNKSGDRFKTAESSGSWRNSSSSQLSNSDREKTDAPLSFGMRISTAIPVKGGGSLDAGPELKNISTSDFVYSVRDEWSQIISTKGDITGTVSGSRSTLGEKQGRTSPLNRIHSSHIRRQERHSAVIRMLIVLVMSFALLNLPIHVRKLSVHYLPSFDMSSDLNNIFAPLTFLLTYANCAINPILYAFLSKRFRQSFVDLLHFRRGRASLPQSPVFV